ncbi:MAG: S41 family peptidase [Lachnospiraceae bacterium]|nr:S41 family peptidase [Lachnospiraceae bacterium]
MTEENGQQTPVPPAGQAPEDKDKKSRSSFLTGLATGLAVATVLCIAVFLAWFRMTSAGAGSGTSAGGEDILNRETLQKIREINETIDTYYYKDDEVSLEARRDGLYEGLVASLGDPYADYYTVEDREAQREQMTGIYYGIGAYVTMHQELQRVYITGVIPNSPAEAAGLKGEDVIWAVDGTSTEGMVTEDVVALIRGPEGTQVELTLLRNGDEEIEVAVTRAQVESQTVAHEMLDNSIGYLQITAFEEATIGQFADAMEELYAEGMQGLILDLRYNLGGSLRAVVEIGNLLLPKGEIVYTLDKHGKRESYVSDGKHEIQIPLVVLVNDSSASASEILAGAIKDYEKGTLVGTTTYGKGIVQSIIDFDDGTGIKLTVSDYYTPKGNNIHEVGIEPDILLEFDWEVFDEDGTDNQLEEAKTLVLDMMK